jgi:D-alanyl-D-alanine carboxypeptidase
METIMKAVLLAALVALSMPACAPPPLADAKAGDDLTRKLDDYVASFADSGFFSGVVMIRKDGKTIYQRASGIAERAFDNPVQMDTKFQIASLSKPMTSVGIAKLVEAGRLTYETKIASIVPGIPNGDRITIEQLLTHMSGLASPDRNSDYFEWRRFPQSTEDLVARVRVTKPDFEPGVKYSYANANYWILANAIERLSGLSYGDFMEREVCRPANMKDTAHRSDVLRVVPLLADGYQIDGPNSYRRAEFVDWTSKTGNGSIYSTAADILNFYDAFKANRLTKPAVTRRIFGDGKGIGFGWFHRPASFIHKSYFYNGRSPGYSSYLEGFQDEDTEFVVLSNLYDFAPAAMADGIAAILSGQPYKRLEPFKPYPVSASDLKRFEFVVEFGPDFHLRNGKARLVAAGDHMKMHWEAGNITTTLLPVAADTFFDPTFWATLHFVKVHGKWTVEFHSQGFEKTYIGNEVPDSAMPHLPN